MRIQSQATQPRIFRPFLKWFGGKQRISSFIVENFQPEFDKYIELFLGGGAVFFEMFNRPSAYARLRYLRENHAVWPALLCDSNQELIDTYRAVRDDVERVIALLRFFSYSKERYYEIRAINPFELTQTERAARMIFLNRTGFNGLYRVNSEGKFNVPFGRHKNPTICDEQTLRNASYALSYATLICGDGIEVLKDFNTPNSIAYVDPPYLGQIKRVRNLEEGKQLSSSSNKMFNSYGSDRFSETKLQKLADALAEAKGQRIISQPAGSSIQDQLTWQGFEFKEVEIARTCGHSKRHRTLEVVGISS